MHGFCLVQILHGNQSDILKHWFSIARRRLREDCEKTNIAAVEELISYQTEWVPSLFWCSFCIVFVSVLSASASFVHCSRGHWHLRLYLESLGSKKRTRIWYNTSSLPAPLNQSALVPSNRSGSSKGSACLGTLNPNPLSFVVLNYSCKRQCKVCLQKKNLFSSSSFSSGLK